MRRDFASIPHIYRDYRDMLARTPPDPIAESEQFFAINLEGAQRNLMTDATASGSVPLWSFAVLTRYGIYLEGRFVGRMRPTFDGGETTLGVVCRWDGVGISLGYWGYSIQGEKQAALPHIRTLLAEPWVSQDALMALRNPRWARNDFNPWVLETAPISGSLAQDNRWLAYQNGLGNGELRFTSRPVQGYTSSEEGFYLHPNKGVKVRPQYFEDLLPLPEPIDVGAYSIAVDHALTDNRYRDVLRDMPYLCRLLEDKKISPTSWFLRSSWWATKLFKMGMTSGIDAKNWAPWLVPTAFVSCPMLTSTHSHAPFLFPDENRLQDPRFNYNIYLMQARMIDGGRSGVLHWLPAADQGAVDRKMLPLIGRGPMDRMAWAYPRYRVRASALPVGGGYPYMPLTDVPAPEYSVPPGDDNAPNHP